MIRLLTAAAVAAALASPTMATAAGNGHGPAAHQPNGCPPGLAKKSPACVPPGHANKTAPQDTTFIYAPGDRITRNYIVLDNPAQYGLNPDRAYYRVGDQVYQIDRHTKEVLDVIGAIAALAN